MAINSKILRFILKYLPPYHLIFAAIIVLALSSLSYFFSSKPLHDTTFSLVTGAFGIFIIIFPCLVRFINYKLYILPYRKEECLKYISFFESKWKFKEPFYLEEVSNNNNEFKHTELIISLEGDYRVIFDNMRDERFREIISK